MKYNFEKWAEAKPVTSPYVRFSKVQLYLPMCFVKLMGETRNFDLLVDKEKRVFAIKTNLVGVFRPKATPIQVGVTQFVKLYKPLIGERLYVKEIEKNVWVGSLDREEL